MALEGIRHLPMALEGIRHLAMALEGIRHLAMALEGIRHLPLALEGIRHLSMALEGIRHLPMTLEGIRHLPMAPRSGAEKKMGVVGRFRAIGKSLLRADANRGSSNVSFAKRERRRVQNSILSESSRRTPRESSGAAANRLSEWGKAGAS